MERLNSKTKGIICIIASAFFFSLMSLFVRMSGDLPTMQKAFFRNAIAAAFAIAILSRTPEKFHIRRESWPDLILRSVDILGKTHPSYIFRECFLGVLCRRRWQKVNGGSRFGSRKTN